jgi:hypothetical protein
VCSLFPPGFPAVPRYCLHTFDVDALPSSRSRTLSLRCVNAGCIPHTPPRLEDFPVTGPLVPGGPTPPLRFLCVAPPLWMGLPPDPTARWRPCLCLAFGCANTWRQDVHLASAVPCPAHTPKLSSGGAPDSLKSQKPIMPRRLLQRFVRRDVLSTGDCARPTP